MTATEALSYYSEGRPIFGAFDEAGYFYGFGLTPREAVANALEELEDDPDTGTEVNAGTPLLVSKALLEAHTGNAPEGPFSWTEDGGVACLKSEFGPEAEEWL